MAATDETTQEIATRFRDLWSRAFAARDIDAIVSLYSEDALLFGSTPDLFLGREGVRAYFAGLRADVALDDFPRQDVHRSGPDTIIAAGYWRFFFGGEARPYRLTWTIVRSDGEWRIAAHHASPRG